MVSFKALSGGARSPATTPLAYILQIDDVQILLDCGSPDWSLESSEIEEPWEEYCQALEQIAPSIDLVLVSHGDLAHAGLFAFAYTYWGLRAPVYMTLPVQAMARIASAEEAECLRAEEKIGRFDSEPENDSSQPTDEVPDAKKPPKGKRVPTVSEVHEAYDTVNTLRYSQPTHLSGKCQGLTITPFSAGHTLGGTIWKIRSPSAGTLLYAVNLNHMRERHLDGTVLLKGGVGGGVFEPLARPDLLITDAERALVISSRRKDRDKALLDAITSTLNSNHSVLIPADASTRVLELLVLLDQHWSYSKLKAPICLISRTGREMLTLVRSMMEWMGGTISKEDVGEREDGTGSKRRREDDDDDGFGALALRFKHLEFFPDPISLLDRYPSSMPKLILAVPSSLSHGPSRALFSDFAGISGNVVLLTSRDEPGTLSRILFERWNNHQSDANKWDRGNVGNTVELDGVITLTMKSKIPLQGAELEAHLQRERAAQEKAAAQKAAIARQQRMLEADDDEEDSDSDSDSDSDQERENDEMEVDGSLGGAAAEPGGGGRRKDNGAGIDWSMGVDADGEGAVPKQISYDIYLKGNVSRAASFFKTAAGQSQRFRMFPYVERKRRVDTYGETVDVGAWLRKGKALEEDAESEEIREAKRKKMEEEQKKKAPVEPPSKYVSQQVEVHLRCTVLFIDMEGLNDGRAVKTIVPQVNPRKMIIVHAPSEATDTLVESCASIRAMTKDIFTPAVGENVQIGQHTNNYAISLSDELLASISMSQFEDSEIGYVRGKITSHASSSIPVLDPIPPSFVPLPSSTPSAESELSLKVLRPLGARMPATLPRSTMIGDLKLTALKARLAAVGISAEFVGEGVLVCGGNPSKAGNGMEESVAVRKTGRGKVMVEGGVSDVYYAVRKEIYGLHAVVEA